MLTFLELLKTVPQIKQFRGSLLVFDPGETTGLAHFTCTDQHPALLTATDQLASAPIEKGCDLIEAAVAKYKPDKVVFENYLVYAGKAQSHSWNELHTPQLIGTIRTICRQQNIPNDKHMAQLAKEFCTDDKLHAWHYWVVGKKHARDAVRHGLYYLLFTHPKLTT